MSVYVSDDLTLAAAGEYVFATNAATGPAPGGPSKTELGAAPTSPVEKDTTRGEIASWGDDNQFPTTVRKEAEESEILQENLGWKADAWYGGGIVYGLVDIDQQGNETFTRVRIPEVEAFLARSRRYAYETLLALSYFANGFGEFILTKDRKQIWSICNQDTEYCRYKKPDAMGVISHIYISANWANSANPDDIVPVPAIDPYFDTPDTIRERTDSWKYIYPVAIPSPGKTLYQLARWNAIRRSGWLNMLKKIPTMKLKMFDNQLSIKYSVEVHHRYWEWKYGDWEIKDKKERQSIIRDEVAAFEKTMTGVEGAGKSIFSITFPDPQDPSKAISAFKVTAIDDKLKSGLYVEDSQEAASWVYTAIGVAPTLRGIHPGKEMGGGSGSDARVAFNNFISTSKFPQDLVLEPLHFVRDYNGWPENLQFRFSAPLIMTLDSGKSSQQETK